MKTKTRRRSGMALPVWESGNAYLIRAWDFYMNDTLTIEEGVIVKSHGTDGRGLTLGGAGTIVAMGSADRPVIFTSHKDDQRGGGAYSETLALGSGQSTVDHCLFAHGSGLSAFVFPRTLTYT